MAWIWQDEQEKSFNFLKQQLIQKPVLALFNPSLETQLFTDASVHGVAGILIQVKDNKQHVIAYYSRHTNPGEQKYHSFELETLAIVSSVQKFRHYLLGRYFTIFTDCVAVKYTFDKKELNARVGRWVLELSQYNFTIKHKSNQQMQHADALSRNPHNNIQNIKTVALIAEEDWLLAAQQPDKKIQKINKILQSGSRHENKAIFNDYALKGGKVYRVTTSGLRWVAPETAKYQILRMVHDDLGHFGVDKTLEIVSRKYWFPHMKRFVTKYVRNCLNCLYFKSLSGKKPGFLHPIPKIPKPFHTVHVDHLGPFIKTKSNNCYILVIIDAFTKFILLYPVRDTTTTHVINAFKSMFKVFGVVARIISDQGKAFPSKKFSTFVTELGINHHLNAVALPRGNGQVERYTRVITESLAAMGGGTHDREWDENIHNLHLGLNGTLNKALGVTPSEALMGFRVFNTRLLSEDENDCPLDLTAIRSQMQTLIRAHQDEQKQRFDKGRITGRNYKVGDLILLRLTSTPNTGTSKKLQPKWRGPFRIAKVLENDRYEVTDIPGAVRSQVPYKGLAGLENIKPWIRFGDQ